MMSLTQNNNIIVIIIILVLPYRVLHEVSFRVDLYRWRWLITPWRTFVNNRSRSLSKRQLSNNVSWKADYMSLFDGERVTMSFLYSIEVC